MVAEEFFIRNVEKYDIKKIFELSNDALVRKNSLATKEISWEEHQNWFEKRLRSNMPFYIVETKEKDTIAQVRFDKKENNEIYISISITPKYRGKHLATNIILTSLQKTGYNTVYATIKKQNPVSLKAFEKAGYKYDSETPEYIKLCYKN